MKMPKLHYLAGKDANRPTLQYIQIRDGKAIVTDAHVLTEIPLGRFNTEFDEIDELYVHKEEWKNISKPGCNYFDVDRERNIVKAYQDKGMQQLKGQAVMYTPEEFSTETGGIYPKTDSVKPDRGRISAIPRIGVQTRLMKQIDMTFDHPCVLMEFTGHNTAIILTIKEGEDQVAEGILMPIRLHR